jgi:hypothetical protein
LSISLKAAAAFLGVIGAVSSAYGESDGEAVIAKGILARGDMVVLFTQVSHCVAPSEPVVPAAQMFFSSDGGRTWSKRGPEVEGGEFRYVLNTAGGLWVAGLHIVEEGNDPFILAPGTKPFEWDLRSIYDGASDLGLVAFRKDGELLAWVHHYDHLNDKWQTYLHASSDGGRRWRTVGRAKRDYPKGLREFEEIKKRTPEWRIADRQDSQFAIEHRAGTRQPWQTVSEFPLPKCDP